MLNNLSSWRLNPPLSWLISEKTSAFPFSLLHPLLLSSSAAGLAEPETDFSTCFPLLSTSFGMLETVTAFFFTAAGGGVSEDWLSGRGEFGESEVHVDESIN